MHARTSAIPPHEANASEINKAATEAGNFSMTEMSVSEITGNDILVILSSSLWAMLPQNVMAAQTTPVTQVNKARDVPWIRIETVSDVGRVSGFGRIFAIKMNLKNSRVTVMMKKGEQVARAL